jgi:hypothetical protein
VKNRRDVGKQVRVVRRVLEHLPERRAGDAPRIIFNKRDLHLVVAVAAEAPRGGGAVGQRRKFPSG